MLEVELKFRADSLDRITDDLAELGARVDEPIAQVDQYFAHPSRDFGRTDEALRIRRIGERNFVTYKGPKEKGKEKGDILLFQHAASPKPQSMPEKVECPLFPKTRREIELPLHPGEAAAEQFCELLAALGFLPAGTVRKLRTAHHLTWQSRPVEVAVDRVDGLGTFVEIETVAAEAELAWARDAVLSLASALGLEAGERLSYLELLLAAPGAGRRD